MGTVSPEDYEKESDLSLSPDPLGLHWESEVIPDVEKHHLVSALAVVTRVSPVSESVSVSRSTP